MSYTIICYHMLLTYDTFVAIMFLTNRRGPKRNLQTKEFKDEGQARTVHIFFGGLNLFASRCRGLPIRH